MKLAIIGSRSFNNFQLLQLNLQQLSFDITLIISGGATGADSLGKKYAQKNGIPFLEYLPDYKKHGKIAPVIRNQSIVKDADFIIAFWDGKSRGTLDAILKAKRLQKQIKIVTF